MHQNSLAVIPDLIRNPWILKQVQGDKRKYLVHFILLFLLDKLKMILSYDFIIINFVGLSSTF